jgi:hypothetical protein
MLRKVIAASIVLVLCVGVAFADEIRGAITKVDGNKITFAKREGKGKDSKLGEPQTLPVAKNVKIVKGVRNQETKKFEAGDPIEGGLKHKMFSEIDAEKGLGALIITDSGNKQITEIRIMQRRKQN